ncbi:MAG: glycoside hydrolase family 1 protein [Anaerolineales bacterium]
MPEATFHFPRGFLWGSATAAHQVEGNNTNNNWYAWEQQPGRILNGDKSGLACDWWGGRWREDFDRAAETGQNAHRLSVEWSRIQPAPDRWDESALDHYRQMLQGLRERGLTPMVTLHHFTDPLWLVERGGWEHAGAAELFAAYTEKVVEALREYVRLWVPINEPNVYIFSGYISGDFPPGRHNPDLAGRVLANMMRGHAAAYQTIHRLQPDAMVGAAINFRDFVPARDWSPLDRWSAGQLWENFNEAFLDALAYGKYRLFLRGRRLQEAKGTQDFVGVNYYTRDTVAFSLANPGEMFSRRFFRPEAELSDTGMLANEPDGFFNVLKRVQRYRLPIYITENGLEDADDHLRPRYLVEHIHQLWRAVNFNWQIRGYFHWSLVDNFEWERGWTQRFGLWGLDVNTQARRRRLSVDLYQAINAENGLSSEMVRKYAPAAVEQLFPG